MCHRADHREPESVDAESVGAVARLRAELRRAEREIRKLRRGLPRSVTSTLHRNLTLNRPRRASMNAKRSHHTSITEVLRRPIESAQYHAKTYQIALRRLEIRQSASRTGSCLDGAAAESFFATIKSEIGADSWPDHATARRDIENWIRTYDERRLHSAVGYKTPTELRIAWQQRMSMAA